MVGQIVSECCGTLLAFVWSIIDQCKMPQKQITLEAMHTAQRIPLLNMRRGSRNEELTLKYKSKVVMLLYSKITY